MTRSEILLQMLLRFALGFGVTIFLSLAGTSMGNQAASNHLKYPVSFTWNALAQPFIAGLSVGLVIAFMFYRKTYKAGDVVWYKPYIIGLSMATIWIMSLFLVTLTT